MANNDTAWKVSKCGVFVVRIFPNSDWIRKDTPYLSIFNPNAGKYGPEKTPYLDTFHVVWRRWFEKNGKIYRKMKNGKIYRKMKERELISENLVWTLKLLMSIYHTKGKEGWYLTMIENLILLIMLNTTLFYRNPTLNLWRLNFKQR